MSFSDRERSVADGQAISLYDFRLGPIRWTYTTANRDIEFNNMTFRARPVSDDGRRMTGQASADIMTVTGPSDLEVAQLYRGARPSKAPTLTVWDIHWNEPQGLVVWMGRIDEVNWPTAGCRSNAGCSVPNHAHRSASHGDVSALTRCSITTAG